MKTVCQRVLRLFLMSFTSVGLLMAATACAGETIPSSGTDVFDEAESKTITYDNKIPLEDLTTPTDSAEELLGRLDGHPLSFIPPNAAEWMGFLDMYPSQNQPVCTRKTSEGHYYTVDQATDGSRLFQFFQSGSVGSWPYQSHCLYWPVGLEAPAVPEGPVRLIEVDDPFIQRMIDKKGIPGSNVPYLYNLLCSSDFREKEGYCLYGEFTTLYPTREGLVIVTYTPTDGEAIRVEYSSVQDAEKAKEQFHEQLAEKEYTVDIDELNSSIFREAFDCTILALDQL